VYLAIQKWKELLPAAQEVTAQDYARTTAGPPGSSPAAQSNGNGASSSAAAAAAVVEESDDELVAVEALTLDEAILVRSWPFLVERGQELSFIVAVKTLTLGKAILVRFGVGEERVGLSFRIAVEALTLVIAASICCWVFSVEMESGGFGASSLL
jgi:hypothetical protein